MLVRDGRPVGYRKQVGALEMFSRDGYAFSGRPIPHDRAVPETPLRTVQGRRVFEGDVVELRPAPDADLEPHVVLLEDGRTRIARPGTSRLQDPEEAWPHLQAVSIQRRLGSIHAGPQWSKLFAGAVDEARETNPHPWPTALRMASAVAVGGALSAVLQLRGLGVIGPLGVCLGAAIGAIAAAAIERQAFGHSLRPAFLARVGPRAAAVNAVLTASAYLLASLTGSLEMEAQAQGMGTAAAAALGGLSTLALVMTVGNAVDHYTPTRPSSPAPPDAQ